ncbi:MAG: hypothetical protein ABIH67_01505 [Candidatus Uhrbacteria bacterium]
MRFKDILAILSLLTVAIIGGWLAYRFWWIDPLVENQQSFGLPVEQPILSQTYTNETFGFGFLYPSSYKIIKEDLIDMSAYREERINELILVLADFSGLQRKILTLYVNKEMPIERADRTLTLLQDDIGIFLSDIFENRFLGREYVRSVGSLVMSDDNVYTWEFVFERGKYDYGPELNTMFEYFGIFRSGE